MGVSTQTRLTLWTRSAGRCHICNAPLLGDLLSGQDELNNGYVAHIVADSPGGPRGDAILSPELADDVSNLMLLCNKHHRLIDGHKTRHEYPVSRLLALKAAHEARIDIVTGVHPDRASHVVLYAARVGEHDCAARLTLAKEAMLPERYPASREAIALDLARCEFEDNEADYWSVQRLNLQRQFDRKVRMQLADGHIKHLSIFALAPQPLLVELGRLLSDIPEVDVHQLHREPQGWGWRETRDPITYEVSKRDGEGKAVALILSLSGTIADARIETVLGEAPIWRVTTMNPHNDIMHRREDLGLFRQTMRRVFDLIKNEHGQDAVIHIFPALPVSAAIEVGRVWMPKADLPLVIHDEDRVRGGFKPRLTIGNSMPSVQARKDFEDA